nr:chlanectin coding region [Chlamydia trachomatis]
MSRKARDPIVLPQGVEVSIQNDEISVKGPKGSLTQVLAKEVEIAVKGNEVFVAPAAHVVDRPGRMQGLYWALIANMVKGVHTGFEKRLEMIMVASPTGKASAHLHSVLTSQGIVGDSVEVVTIHKFLKDMRRGRSPVDHPIRASYRKRWMYSCCSRRRRENL